MDNVKPDAHFPAIDSISIGTKATRKLRFRILPKPTWNHTIAWFASNITSTMSRAMPFICGLAMRPPLRDLPGYYLNGGQRISTHGSRNDRSDL